MFLDWMLGSVMDSGKCFVRFGPAYQSRQSRVACHSES